MKGKTKKMIKDGLTGFLIGSLWLLLMIGTSMWIFYIFKILINVIPLKEILIDLNLQNKPRTLALTAVGMAITLKIITIYIPTKITMDLVKFFGWMDKK